MVMSRDAEVLNLQIGQGVFSPEKGSLFGAPQSSSSSVTHFGIAEYHQAQKMVRRSKAVP
jgi:hypothetical protein